MYATTVAASRDAWSCLHPEPEGRSAVALTRLAQIDTASLVPSIKVRHHPGSDEAADVNVSVQCSRPSQLMLVNVNKAGAGPLRALSKNSFADATAAGEACFA